MLDDMGQFFEAEVLGINGRQELCTPSFAALARAQFQTAPTSTTSLLTAEEGCVLGYAKIMKLHCCVLWAALVSAARYAHRLRYDPKLSQNRVAETIH